MLFVVIPTHNRREHLLRCLRCLAVQTVPHRVVIADSAASDGTGKAVAERFPEAVVLSGHASLWWAGAINLGLREVLSHASDSDHFLLLNDDTEFDARYLEVLMHVASQGHRRIVGSLCVDRDNPDVVVDGGVRVNWLTAKFDCLNVGRTLGSMPLDHLERVSVLPGRGTLYPLSVCRDVGLFAEEKLPHYAADYEFSRRCALAGYDLLVAYDAVVRSDLSTTGIHVPRGRFGLAAAREFFFSRRSACNLVDRFHFSYSTAPSAWQATVFFLCSLARLLYRFLRRPVARF